MVQWDQLMQWGDFQSAFYGPSGMQATTWEVKGRNRQANGKMVHVQCIYSCINPSNNETEPLRKNHRRRCRQKIIGADL